MRSKNYRWETHHLIFKEGFRESRKFLEELYGDDLKENEEWKNLELGNIHFSNNSGHCRFFPDFKTRKRKHSKHRPIFIGLKGVNQYLSYCKKTKLGYLTPITPIELEPFFGFTSRLVHEMTHYVQYLQNKKYSEVETTENEILYLLDNDVRMSREGRLDINSMLIPYEVRREQERRQKEYVTINDTLWKERDYGVHDLTDKLKQLYQPNTTVYTFNRLEEKKEKVVPSF